MRTSEPRPYRSHSLVVDYVMRMGPQAGPNERSRSAHGEDLSTSPGFKLLDAIAKVLDDDLSWMVRRIASRGTVDQEALDAAGRARPGVILDAYLTTKDNLRFVVRPGPLDLDADVLDHRIQASRDWTRFPPDDEAYFDQRPLAEVAFIRDADRLFTSPGKSYWAEDDTRVELALRRESTSRLSRMVVAAWEHCKAALQVHYDVHEGIAPVPVDAEGAETRSAPSHLRLLHPSERERFREAVARDGAERERRDVEDRTARARRLLSALATDGVDLALSIRLATPEKGLNEAIARILTRNGLKSTPTSWPRMLETLEEALDLCKDGWRQVARTVKPMTPAKPTRLPRPVRTTRASLDVATDR